MTDVIFLLLLFLLIASNFAGQTGIPIKLPGSTTASRQNHQTINITYYNDGSIFFMNRQIQLSELKAELSPLFNNSDQVIKLSAEDKVELQKVITLMDVIRSVGFERIFVATIPVKE